jgi:hypothetical protein
MPKTKRANFGWINLSNPVYFRQNQSHAPGAIAIPIYSIFIQKSMPSRVLLDNSKPYASAQMDTNSMVKANHLTESPNLYMITVEIAATMIPETRRVTEKMFSSKVIWI